MVNRAALILLIVLICVDRTSGQSGNPDTEWTKAKYPKVYESIKVKVYSVLGKNNKGFAEVHRQCVAFKDFMERYPDEKTMLKEKDMLEKHTAITHCDTCKYDKDSWLACWNADWVNIASQLSGGPEIVRSDDGTVQIHCRCRNPNSIETEYDEIEDETSVTNKGFLVLSQSKSKKIGIYFYKSSWMSSTYTFGIKVYGAGCIDDDNAIVILFDDGTRIEDENGDDFNCKNDFRLFWNYERDYEYDFMDHSDKTLKLLTTTIKAIRVYTHDSSVEVRLSKKEKEDMRDLFGCFINAIQQERNKRQ